MTQVVQYLRMIKSNNQIIGNIEGLLRAMQLPLRDDQKLQGLVQQCVYKTVELVLHARIPHQAERGADKLRRSNLWVRRPRAAMSALRIQRSIAHQLLCSLLVQFNIESEEMPRVREQLDCWRAQFSQPLQVDVFVPPHETQPTELLLERWVLQYEPSFAEPHRIGWPVFYKRFMVLLRTVISFLRLMPTKCVAASLNRGGRHLLDYRITVGTNTLSGEPPAAANISLWRQHDFPPPDWQHGRLQIKVFFLPTSAGKRHADPVAHLYSNVSINTPLAGQLIHNYLNTVVHAPLAAVAPLTALASQAKCLHDVAAGERKSHSGLKQCLELEQPCGSMQSSAPMMVEATPDSFGMATVEPLQPRYSNCPKQHSSLHKERATEHTHSSLPIPTHRQSPLGSASFPSRPNSFAMSPMQLMTLGQPQPGLSSHEGLCSTNVGLPSSKFGLSSSGRQISSSLPRAALAGLPPEAGIIAASPGANLCACPISHTLDRLNNPPQLSSSLRGSPHLGMTSPASPRLSSAQQDEIEIHAAAAVWAQQSFSGATYELPSQIQLERKPGSGPDVQEAMLGSFMMEVRFTPRPIPNSTSLNPSSISPPYQRKAHGGNPLWLGSRAPA